MTITNEPEGSKPVCPRCGAPMVWLTPANNMGRQWIPFWSCTRYPACIGRIERPDLVPKEKKE